METTTTFTPVKELTEEELKLLALKNPEALALMVSTDDGDEPEVTEDKPTLH